MKIKNLIAFRSSLLGMSLLKGLPPAFTFSCVCWRMLMVIFHAGKLHETSRETVRVISDVPADVTVDEIGYFREYLKTTKVVLTGCGFFALTKRLMLTVRICGNVQHVTS